MQQVCMNPEAQLEFIVSRPNQTVHLYSIYFDLFALVRSDLLKIRFSTRTYFHGYFLITSQCYKGKQIFKFKEQKYVLNLLKFQ